MTTTRKQAGELREQVDRLREQAQTLEDLASALRSLANALVGIEEILEYAREQVKPRPEPTDCTNCGMTYAACTAQVQGKRRGPARACCLECAEHDMHGLMEAGLL